MKAFVFALLFLGATTLIANATNEIVPMNTESTTMVSISDNNTTEDKAKWVSFTLRNNGLKSIPLLIPGVMNPNLSPQSNSGVSLKVGQKVLFRYKGKKRVLLVVSENLEGEVLNVSKLLKEKKRELDAQR